MTRQNKRVKPQSHSHFEGRYPHYHTHHNTMPRDHTHTEEDIESHHIHIAEHPRTANNRALREDLAMTASQQDKYLPPANDPDRGIIKLTRYQGALMLFCLTNNLSVPRRALSAIEAITRARLAKQIDPANTAGEFMFYRRDWTVISRALRPQGSNPPAGSDSARALSLYRLVCRKSGVRG